MSVRRAFTDWSLLLSKTVKAQDARASFEIARRMRDTGVVPSVQDYENLVHACTFEPGMARIAMELTLSAMKSHQYKPRPHVVHRLNAMVSRSRSYIDQTMFLNLLKQCGVKQLWVYAGVEVSRLLNAREYEHAVQVFKSAIKFYEEKNQVDRRLAENLKLFALMWTAVAREDVETLAYFLEVVEKSGALVSEKLVDAILSVVWGHTETSYELVSKLYALCEEEIIPVDLSESSLVGLCEIVARKYDVGLTQRIVKQVLKVRKSLEMTADLARLTVVSYCSHTVASHSTLWRVFQQLHMSGIEFTLADTPEMTRSYGQLDKKSRLLTFAKDLGHLSDPGSHKIITHSVVCAIKDTTNFSGMAYFLSELEGIDSLDRQTWDVVVRLSAESSSAKLCSLTLLEYFKKSGFKISLQNYESFALAQLQGQNAEHLPSILEECRATHGKVPPRVERELAEAGVSAEDVIPTRKYHQEYDERDNELLRRALSV